MSKGIGRLSEGQKACLRLVRVGFEAKEIARELGLNPHTVIERLRAARRVLGVASSREAARLLAAHEAEPGYNRHGNTPIGVVSSVDLDAFSSPSIGHGTATEEAQLHLLREEQAGYSFREQAASSPFPWSVPAGGRRRNRLTVLQTVGVIVALTFGLAVTALVVVASVEELSRLHAG